LLGDPGHAGMVEFLKQVPARLGSPSAILVISSHWDEDQPTITSGAHPSLIYDYGGFPDEAYQVAYPASGDPGLARRVHGLLKAGGIESRLDDHRGFDHGLFVPLKIMYPEANIPAIQLSLLSSLDPAQHIRIGKALSALRTENVLVIGSGFSFHNMHAFFSSPPGAPDPKNDAFQQWLLETCTREDIPQEERERALIGWESAPFARYCHPREEHLLSLHVCCGLAGSPARVVFDGTVLGKRALGFLW
jgi:aromatic ring-opening dioxygenase catalytic subunit (LigB family)